MIAVPESQTIAFGDLQQIYYGDVKPPNAVPGTIFIHTTNKTMEIKLLNGSWIFLIAGGTVVTPYSSGTLTADGSEQQIVELVAVGKLVGWVSFKNMQAGDIVTIRHYVKLLNVGSYEMYDEIAWNDVQPDPLLYIHSREGQYGVKITLKQSSGAYRDFDYAFFRE